MTLPKPKVALTGSCSVIYDNTLYSFSEAAFQSLNLEKGAEWEQLASGQAVEGAVCVGSTPTDASQAGLYVVGGTSNDTNYKGLQKFTYSTGKWETIEPQVAVTQSRLRHSATYINDSDTILVYAGSQDGSDGPSSQTFTIGASAPYQVLAFQNPTAPPATQPILLPWSDKQAVMIGGASTNTNVMLFESTSGWSNSNATLAQPLLEGTSKVKAAIMTGDDGSKHLYTFDATQSPNQVNRTVLYSASGTPVAHSEPIVGGNTISKSENDRRELTTSDWPSYNASLAPTATRSGYAIATSSNGLVVMSGGNDDDVLCIFDAMTNSWDNATAKLVGKEEVSIASLPSSSSSSTSSQTATSESPTATASESTSTSTSSASSSGSSSSLPPQSILGIALGVIFGVAIILIFLLFMLKRRRQQKTYTEAGHNRRASGIPEKKYPPNNVAQASGGYFPGHNQQDSQGSFSSVAILMGRAQKPGPGAAAAGGVQHNASDGTKRSSVSSVFNKQFKSTIGRPQPVPESIAEPDYVPQDEKTIAFAAQPKAKAAPSVMNQKDSTRRSSGWNRYWSGGSTLNLLGFGSASKRETGVSDQSQTSHYSDMNRMTQDSAAVLPLNVEGIPELNRVNSGSPTVANYSHKMKEHMSATIERPLSTASSSGYSSGIPPSVHDNWDPTTAAKPWGHDRAPSSAYSASIYPTALGAPNSRPTTAVPQHHNTASLASDMSWLKLDPNPHR